MLEAKMKGVTQYLGAIVTLSVVRELGPVLVALIVSGRVGSSMAAEIGTMKVTEQVDALITLNSNPIQYLFVPRFLASAFMLPCLTALADFLGIIGGIIVSWAEYKINPRVYIENAASYTDMTDVMEGIIKSIIFGIIIAIVSCIQGDKTEGGAEGVGKATTRAVVVSMMCILIADYIVAKILRIIL